MQESSNQAEKDNLERQHENLKKALSDVRKIKE